MSGGGARGSAYVILLLLACGCVHVPYRALAAGASPRTLPPPPRLRPLEGGWDWRVRQLPRLSGEAWRVQEFRYRIYDDVLGRYATVTGALYLPRRAGRFGLIAVSPILGGAEGGYLECHVFGRQAARRGYASFYLYQERKLLRPAWDATGLERRLESWVRRMIRSIDLVAERYPIDRRRIGSFGISMGGIRNIALIAAEPRLVANVICMAGADLAEVLEGSRETLVKRYLARRLELTGIDRERIIADFRHHLASDPLRVAPAIAPDRVLLFLARFDDKVPIATGFLLHRALGRPELRVAPLGHYTALLVVPWAIRHGFEFFEDAFAGAARSSASPRGAAQPP